MKPTQRQRELEALVDTVLAEHDYELDLDEAARIAAERCGGNPKELEKAYCIVNRMTYTP